MVNVFVEQQVVAVKTIPQVDTNYDVTVLAECGSPIELSRFFSLEVPRALFTASKKTSL